MLLTVWVVDFDFEYIPREGREGTTGYIFNTIEVHEQDSSANSGLSPGSLGSMIPTL
jgi:hypothetical protein